MSAASEGAGVGLMIGGASGPLLGMWLGHKLIDPSILEPRLRKFDAFEAERRRQRHYKHGRRTALILGLVLFVPGLVLLLS